MPDLDEITAGEQPLAGGWRENNESGQDHPGLEKSRVRLYTAITRAHRPGHGRSGRLRRHRHQPAAPPAHGSPAGRAGQPARPPPRGPIPPTCPIQLRALAQADSVAPRPAQPGTTSAPAYP